MAGVSVQELGGRRFRVRWREWVEEDGERTRAERSQVVHSREAAIELQAKVLRALETRGWFELEAKPEQVVGNLEIAGQAWLKHKAARGCADGSIERYAASLARWFRFIRGTCGVGVGAEVPVTVLTRNLFSDAILAWRGEKLADATIYNTARVAVDLWNWTFDDLATYPGVPTPPRDKKALLPQPAVYVAPEPPTMAELDACLRALHFRAYTARGAGVVMRFTGLRVSQVLALTCGDVNLARAELCVTTGKSRREKAEKRVVPISAHLVAELAPRVANSVPTAPLIKRRATGREPAHHLPMRTLEAAWEVATKAGHARREVWDPPNREVARPEHAFRAGFQGFLDGHGIKDAAIDYLVGHSPKSIRGRHYSPPTSEQLRAAVDLLPPIEWATDDVADGLPDNVRRLDRTV